MTRQLVDVLMDAHVTEPWESYDDIANRIVASLLTDGPVEHTVVCPTCEGTGIPEHVYGFQRSPHCLDCTDGRQTVIVRAEVKR